MNPDMLDALIDSTNDFLVPLRTLSGFDEAKFESLCEVLRSCGNEWSGVELIPKRAADVLIDLFPLTLACADLYRGPEVDRIREAAVTLNSLSKDALE
jgi:hypothetical protein